LHVPHALFPFILAVIAIVGAVFGWAVLSLRSLGGGGQPAVPQLPNLDRVHSIAYIEASNGVDRLYISRTTGDMRPELAAAFPHLLNFNARGAAAPSGDRIAVLSVGDRPAEPAQLTLIDLPGRARRDLNVSVDYLSPIAWSPAGDRLAMVRSEPGAQGRTRRVLVQVDAATGLASETGHFDGAFDVAPLGYTADGKRLMVAVVDASGSSLWALREGRQEQIATLSPGPTRDWKLSADGSRLAFVDRLGVGERRYAGRTLVIATGQMTDAPGTQDQLGTVWRPGVDVAEFGGPGGTLQLSERAGAGYLIPEGWSPDGSKLVASVYPAGTVTEAGGSTQLLSIGADDRTVVAPGQDVRFLGWVQDLE
jgi:hypothetical protein